MGVTSAAHSVFVLVVKSRYRGKSPGIEMYSSVRLALWFSMRHEASATRAPRIDSVTGSSPSDDVALASPSRFPFGATSCTSESARS